MAEKKKRPNLIMAKIFLISLLLCSTIHADIIETADLQSIKRGIFSFHKDTLIVFDIDFVLITPDDNVFLMTAGEEGQKFQSNIYNDLWQRLPVHMLDELHTTIITTQP